MSSAWGCQSPSRARVPPTCAPRRLLAKTTRSCTASGWDTARPVSTGSVRKASSDVTAGDAVTSLTGAFVDASVRLDAGTADDRPSVVISWPAVPIEIVRAVGLSLRIGRGGAAPTPAADAHVEGAVFPNRIRQLMEAVLAGRLGQASCVVLPRTSSADYHG